MSRLSAVRRSQIPAGTKIRGLRSSIAVFEVVWKDIS